MKMLLLGYPGCRECQRAKTWLMIRSFDFESRDIVAQNPTKEELSAWYARSGLPLKAFICSSSKSYRQMKLSSRIASMTEDEQLSLLASNGSLLSRPILVTDDLVIIGFDAHIWAEKLMNGAEGLLFDREELSDSQ